MASRIPTDPQAIEARLRNVALALYASANDHPLIELGDKACTFIIELIAKDLVHKLDEKGYRGFYNAIQDISSFPPGQLPSWSVKKKVDARYEAALKTHKTPVCKWEDALILTGSIVSTISSAPGLDLLKSVGNLSQIEDHTGEQSGIRELASALRRTLIRIRDIIMELERDLIRNP
ncbi:hypothetical protein PQX77_015839 [Marasmius sp. AFHP31]|nr:hypothetical protein PQX77_015839 [Marasmius sp. AFHP31]